MFSKMTKKWFKIIHQDIVILLIAVIAGLSVNQIRSDSLPLFGDWRTEKHLTSDLGEAKEIFLEEAEEFFRAQSAVFIDTRSREFYKMGHIKGEHAACHGKILKIASRKLWRIFFRIT